MNYRRGWLSRSLLLAVVSAGCGQPNQYQPPPPPAVTVAKPVRQTVTNYLEETGSTEPVEMVAIRARVTGFLEKALFEPGTDVQAGDTLYIIQQREYQAKVASAKAEVDSMQVALKLAEIEYKRQKNLAADNATAQTKVDQAEAARDAAVAALEAAKAAFDQAELDLDYTEVKTPISGRVGKSLVKVGNLVGEGEATHLTTVVAYDPIYVNFNISERELLRASQNSERGPDDKPDITKIKAYMKRAIDSGFPFAGHLDYADLGVDQSTGTFMIRAIFPNPKMEIFPGLFVRVRIPLGVLEDAVLIPERALGIDQAGRYVMIVGDDDVVERRDVKIGEKYEDMVVVMDGLSGEERVVIKGLQRSRPGAKVSPNEEQLQPVAGELEAIEAGHNPPPPAASADPATENLKPPAAADPSAGSNAADAKPAESK